MALDQREFSRPPTAFPAALRHDVIVVGTSAGGVEALQKLFRDLGSDLDAALFVVLHTSPIMTSHMAEILNKQGGLPACYPAEEEDIEWGKIYVAPSNRHLMLEDSKVFVTTAPKENRQRPAINPLFRSAALAYGPRVIGVVLTGMLDDGAAGLWEIKRRGGIAVVQSPDDAAYPQMPRSALESVAVDYIVPLGEMADLLISLCKCEAIGQQQDPRRIRSI